MSSGTFIQQFMSSHTAKVVHFTIDIPGYLLSTNSLKLLGQSTQNFVAEAPVRILADRNLVRTEAAYDSFSNK